MRALRARRKNEEGRKKRTERIKRMGIAGEKNKWREEKDYRKTEIQRKIPGKFTISKEGVLQAKEIYYRQRRFTVDKEGLL